MDGTRNVFYRYNNHSPTITNSEPENQLVAPDSSIASDELNYFRNHNDIINSDSDIRYTDIDHSYNCDECEAYLLQVFEQCPDTSFFDWDKIFNAHSPTPLKNGDTHCLETLYNCSLDITGFADENVSVSITGEMNTNFVSAIPWPVTSIVLGPGISPATVKAIPPHIAIVKIDKEVPLQTIAALPRHIKYVVFENDVTAEAAAILPHHVEAVFITDIIETKAENQRSVHLLNKMVQTIGVTTEIIDAIPLHISVVHIGYKLIIRKGEPQFQINPCSPGLQVSDSPLVEMKANPNSTTLFHAKLSSAFKVNHVGDAENLVEMHMRKGWRWLNRGFITNGVEMRVRYAGKMPGLSEGDWVVSQAKRMPKLSKGDWIVSEGKTLRKLNINNMDQDERMLFARLDQRFAQINQNDVGMKLKNMFARMYIGSYDPFLFSREVDILYPGYLPPQIFKNSYARIGGKYIRDLERRPQLQKAFNMFFDVETVQKKIDVKLWSQKQPRTYQKYLSVRLKNKIIEDKDIPFIRSLGVDLIAVDPQSTVTNTIPLKKVLEILTCFDTNTYAQSPWLVSLTIFGGERYVLISQGYGNAQKQLLISTRREGDLFIGNTYSWMCREKPSQSVINALESPISESCQLTNHWKEIIEFQFSTHIAESHCMPGDLNNSRVPGSAKLARSILRYNTVNKLPLSSSFDVNNGGQRIYPLAQNGGVEITRNAVNNLTKPDDAAPCNDMSDDSETEEISYLEYIRREGDSKSKS